MGELDLPHIRVSSVCIRGSFSEIHGAPLPAHNDIKALDLSLLSLCDGTKKLCLKKVEDFVGTGAGRALSLVEGSD